MENFKFEMGLADVSRSQTVTMREPKILEGGRLECPVCGGLFSSRQDYDSHWLACHGDSDVSMASGSMGSMRGNGEGQCEEAANR